MCSTFYQCYQWYTNIVQGSTNGTIRNTIGNNGNVNGTIGSPNCTIGKPRVPLVSQWYHGIPMVPLVKLPMVPLGELRTEPVGLTNGTGTLRLPMVPTFPPMVTLAPIVPLAAEIRALFSGYQWNHWLLMVPFVRFPLGESRMHALSLPYNYFPPF